MSLERFEEQLRESAPTDAPSVERRAASRAAVFAAAGLVAPPPPPTPGAGSTAAATKTALVVKLAIVSALAIGTVVAVVLATRSPSLPSASPSAVTTSSAAVVSLVAPPPEVVSAAASAEPLASTAPPIVLSAAPRPATSAPDPLAVEAALLEAARTCLKTLDTTCAAAKLAEHDQKFPHGALADEAAILEIHTARARGDRDEARRLAERLLAAHPTGPYAKRATAVLRELDDE